MRTEANNRGPQPAPAEADASPSTHPRPSPTTADGGALQAIIFDCDGVLFDSHAANVAFYDAVVREVTGRPLPEDWRERVHVLASTDVYDELFGRGTPAARRAREVARSMGYGPFFRLMRPAERLHETLEILGRSRRLGMATNRRSTTREVVSRFGLGRHLQVAVGAGDVARPKPAPDMLLLCAERLDVPAQTCVYVGDAAADLAAARAAGMAFIGVGNVPGAAVRIRRLAELPAVLDPGRP